MLASPILFYFSLLGFFLILGGFCYIIGSMIYQREESIPLKEDPNDPPTNTHTPT
ncbi:hypothetical protein [Bacillus taeanensis]|uniref:hypothetical protein n=1 Tax=Bacillus taeanensis TaxID=273032 RepID=UPI0015F0DF41|nr:hypothetical protein [Bacillus taeanensis]